MTIENVTRAVETYRKAAESRMAALERQIADLPELKVQVEAAVKAATAVALRANRPDGGAGPANATSAQLAEARKAVANFMRSGGTGKLSDFEPKSMLVGSEPDGGVTVRAALSDAVTAKIFETSPFRSLARVETIDRADALEELVDNDDFEAEWVTETAPRLATSTAQLGMFRVPVDEMHASPKVTQSLLDDSRINLSAWLEAKLASKFGRMESAAFINGSGTGQPRGLITYPTVAAGDGTRPWGTLEYIPTGAAGGFASSSPADALIDTVYALKPAYRDRASWLMPRDAARRVRKMKDGEGRYIWEQSAARGEPDQLLGFPVAYCEDLPAVASDSLSIAFGDFSSGYVIVDRKDLIIVRDPYTAKPYVVFYTTRRVGGGLFNSEAIKLLKFSAS